MRKEDFDRHSWSVAASSPEDLEVGAIRNEMTFGSSRRKLDCLVKRLISAQREYLLVLSALENFFRRSAIDGESREFLEEVKESSGLIQVADLHSKFVEAVVDKCCLNSRGSQLLELFHRLFAEMVRFGHSCRELENSIVIEDPNLDEKIEEVYLAVRKGLIFFRRELSNFLRLVHKFSKNGNSKSKRG